METRDSGPSNEILRIEIQYLKDELRSFKRFCAFICGGLVFPILIGITIMMVQLLIER